MEAENGGVLCTEIVFLPASVYSCGSPWHLKPAAMLNQASREALYSATYLEDYLDCVENMPDDLQRSLTRLRELDIRYQSVLAELERRQAAVRRESNEQYRTKSLLAMQRSLIALQEAGDEKLQLLQSVHDLVDGRCRQLELDYKNLGETMCVMGCGLFPTF